MPTIDEDNGQQKDGDLSAAKRNHILLLQRTYLELGSPWRFGVSLAIWDLVGVFGISLVFGKIKSFRIHTRGVECSILSSTVCNFPESGFWIL